jgi:hypothetical protein
MCKLMRSKPFLWRTKAYYTLFTTSSNTKSTGFCSHSNYIYMLDMHFTFTIAASLNGIKWYTEACVLEKNSILCELGSESLLCTYLYITPGSFSP